MNDFIQTELYPALFEMADKVFPEMGFQRYRGGYRWASPCKLNGDRSHDGRRDKSVITPRYPHRVLEQGGESKDLITLYMEHNGLSKPIDAIKALCSICGLQLPPMEDTESYRLWQEKQERLERAASKMEAALYTDEGAVTLNYLKEVRGYSDEFIKYAHFGFVSPSILKELKTIFQDGTYFPRLSEAHTLAISYRSGGRVRGFVFRSLNPDAPAGDKYKDVFISKKDTKSFHLFGLTGLKLTGNGERDRDITIVEGEIDAIRASFAGLDNVVAASGGNVSGEALQEAKRRGVERVTLLLDADEAGRKFLGKAVENITEEGLKCFVASLPTDGKKVDVDSYLRDHTGEELQKVVEEALPVSLWLFNTLRDRVAASQGEDGLTPKTFEEFKGQTIELCNSPITSPTERDMIFRDFAQATGGEITKESLQEEADLLKLAQDADRQKRETMELASEAFKLASSGSVEEALSLLQGKVTELSQISREAEYSSLLALPTAEGIRARFKEKPTGVNTNFSFRTTYGEQERLLLPVGALTYICAPTSHGKSRFLENLAIQLATNGEGGDVLYFSFEEDNTAVELQLLNIYANMYLSANNLRTLNSYYTKGELYFDRGADLNSFKRKEAEFLSLLSSGKLRVYYKDYDSTELIEAIRYVSKQTRVKAVFVDYIQLLHTRGTRLQRREELGEMCKSLWRLAIEASIPIVLAAQLNREAYSPLDMASQNIAEAADIERSANTIILLWNSAFKPIPQKSSYYRTNKGEQTFTDEAKALEGRDGFHIGAGGKIYAKVSKNRVGSPNMDAVLDYNGSTGAIAPNYSEPQPSQGKISSDGQEESCSPF